MIQLNTKRKKTKESILEEKKKLEKLEKVPNESKKVSLHTFKDYFNICFVIQGIEECEKKIEEQAAKKEKFEEEKTRLLATLNVETKALQERKEEMQTDLAILKKSVDETKSAVSIELITFYIVYLHSNTSSFFQQVIIFLQNCGHNFYMYTFQCDIKTCDSLDLKSLTRFACS